MAERLSFRDTVIDEKHGLTWRDLQEAALHGEINDEDNPTMIFQNTSIKILRRIGKGEIDVIYIAYCELRSRREGR